jgi:hypothetical protein
MRSPQGNWGIDQRFPIEGTLGDLARQGVIAQSGWQLKLPRLRGVCEQLDVMQIDIVFMARIDPFEKPRQRVLRRLGFHMPTVSKRARLARLRIEVRRSRLVAHPKGDINFDITLQWIDSELLAV